MINVASKTTDKIFSQNKLIDMSEIKKASNLLINSLNGKFRYNSNVTICAEDLETAKLHGEKLMEEVRKQPRVVSWANTDEDHLYERKKWSGDDKKCDVILINGFIAKDPEKLYEVLCDIEKEGWGQSVVICTTLDGLEKLKNFKKDDSRLFYYMCGQIVNIPPVTESTISANIFERLEREGWDLTDGFKKKLDIYIRAVYPEAVLTKKAFEDDLVARIYREHFQKIVEGKELNETDVPYSVKAEKVSALSKEDGKSTQSKEKATVREILEKDDVQKENGTEYIEKLEKINENAYNSNSINIVITNVSPLTLKDGKIVIRENKYIDEEGNKFRGEITNEAPIKSIACRLSKENECINKIICITSKTTQKKEVCIDDESEKISHYDYLQKKINTFLGSEKEDLYSPIEIADKPTVSDVSNAVYKISNILLKDVYDKNREKDINIYIESNGGVRYVLTMLLSITKTLENYYNNVNIVEITSMVYNNNSKDKDTRIVNQKDVYDTAQIAGIASEFINYGRVNSLQHYIREYESAFAENEKEDVKKVLGKLNEVAEDIQMCRTSRFLDDFYGENNISIVIDEFIKTYSSEDEELLEERDSASIEENEKKARVGIQILVILLKLIRDEYEGTIYKDIKDKEEKPIVYLPKIIEWCCQKSFMQQALTLCAEKIPEYLLETKIKLSDEFNALIVADHKKNNSYYEINYYIIANLKRLFQKFMEEQVKAFIERPKSESTRVYDEKCEDSKADREEILKEISDSLSSELSEDEIKEQVKRVLEAKSKKKDSLNTYKQNICNIFEQKELADELVNIYKKKELHDKFFIKVASDSGCINSQDGNSLSRRKLTAMQNILYTYSICKEQRNITNHANVSDNDKALNIEQLTILIKRLLVQCNS